MRGKSDDADVIVEGNGSKIPGKMLTFGCFFISLSDVNVWESNQKPASSDDAGRGNGRYGESRWPGRE